MITLKAEAVYSQLRKVTTGKYKSGPNKDQEYVTMSHGTRGFTIPMDIYNLWEKGEISELSLEDSNYDRVVIDTETGEETKVNTLSYAYSGCITNVQEEKVAVHQGKLAAIKAKAAEAYKLDGKALAAAV